MKWILAVDGGGTKTTACAGNLAGKVLGRIEKGPANYHIIGLKNFASLIKSLVDDFCENYLLKKQELELISLGLAGVDRPADRERILMTLNNLGFCCRFIVNNDARVALAAGIDEPAGIVLISGTGSIAYGLTNDGKIVRAGGWGHIISDEGSGYDIGRQALIRSIKALEGRDQPTQLLADIMAYLNRDNLDALIQYIYSPNTSKSALAALAPVVAVAAAHGDATALEIINDASRSLAALVESVLERGFYGVSEVPVCIFGGIINNIPRVGETLAVLLAGNARIVYPEQEPVMGALKLGYDYLKKEATL